MNKYKLSTGLWEVKETPSFNTDEEAWEPVTVEEGEKIKRRYRDI